MKLFESFIRWSAYNISRFISYIFLERKVERVIAGAVFRPIGSRILNWDTFIFRICSQQKSLLFIAMINGFSNPWFYQSKYVFWSKKITFFIQVEILWHSLDNGHNLVPPPPRKSQKQWGNWIIVIFFFLQNFYLTLNLWLLIYYMLLDISHQ